MIWPAQCVAKDMYLYPVGAYSEASVSGTMCKHLNNLHPASHLSSYPCVPRNARALSRIPAELWQLKTMQPDPTSTLGATITMVSHAGLGPYNPPHIIGTAPGTMWNKRPTRCHLVLYRCPRRNVPDFGRVFLMLNYTDITQNTYVQSWTVTEIMASEIWNFDSCYTLTDYQIHITTGRNMWFL